VLRALGDDAAVVRSRPLCVTSVDTMVEGVHFRLDHGWASAGEVGHRALAGALSDLAAMGADAGEAYVALGLPAGFDERSALELVRAADALALRTGTAIVGGDVVVAPALIVSITAIGWAEREDALVGRDGAQAGDLVGVTGRLGAAAATLAAMEHGISPPPGSEPAISRARYPMPRLAEGRALSGAGARAMIDLSDGIATDAGHLARASALRLHVRLDALPLHEGVAELAAAVGVEPWRLAAGGGEDYELCFCAAADARVQIERAVGALGTVEVSWVGEALAGTPGVTLSDDRGDAVRIEGYEHRWQ
jgi:thiamine-monophosphate kinase